MRGIPANGQAIRELRRARAWTQEDLAEACDCTTRTVRNAERGERVDAATLEQIAGALGAPLERVLASEQTGVAEEHRHIGVVQQWVAAFVAADLDRLLALHHPETSLELPGADDVLGDGCRGIGPLREHFEAVFSRYEPIDSRDDLYDAVDSLVFHRSKLSVRNLATGNVITTRCFNEFEFEAGLIKRRTTISDLSQHRRNSGDS